MKTRIFITGLSLVLIFGAVKAQPGWNWPDDKAKAEEKNALYTDSYKQENYRKAATHLHWLLVNAPNLHNSIYINGVKIYNGLADEETDEAKKKVYQDSVMTLYDLRIKYFNNEGKVLNRKAYDAYKYFANDSDRYEEVFNLFKYTFELNGNNVMDINLLPYMDILRRYKKASGTITDEQALDIYDEIINIANYKKEKNGKNVEKINNIIDKVNELLVGTVDVDCDFVESTLGPKLKSEPDNLKLAKNILRLSFAGSCMQDKVAIEAAKVVQKHEPEFGLAKLIGQASASNKEYTTAIKYLTEAVSLTDDNTKKGEVYFSLAVIQANLDKKVSARDYARKALAMDPTIKDAYSLIGNLYYNSFNSCKKGVNPVEDRAVYLAAYEMFRLAGDSQGMSRAKAQFPTMEEIFTWNLHEGDKMTVGCWIGETVSLQKR